jgi:hypothetical protein
MADEILTLSSPSGRVRARVHLLSPGMYRVDVERLIDAFDAGDNWRGQFWSEIEGLTSYADNEARAADLAAQNLRCGLWADCEGEKPGEDTFFDKLLKFLGYGARIRMARCKTLRDFFKVILAGEPHIPVD